MNTSTKRNFIMSGGALLLCLPLGLVIAGLYCYFIPREYSAKATLELSDSTKSYDPHRADVLRQAMDAVPPPLRSATELLEVRNTGLFEIRSVDPVPQAAADRANNLAITLQQKLRAEDPARVPAAGSDPEAATLAAIETQMHRPTIRIWERAEPPLIPARPNVPAVMFLALAVGLLPAGIGGTLLLVAFVAKEHRVLPHPMPT